MGWRADEAAPEGAGGQIAAQSLNFTPVGAGVGAGFGLRGAGGSFSFDRIIGYSSATDPRTTPAVLTAI